MLFDHLKSLQGLTGTEWIWKKFGAVFSKILSIHSARKTLKCIHTNVFHCAPVFLRVLCITSTHCYSCTKSQPTVNFMCSLCQCLAVSSFIILKKHPMKIINK